MPSKSSLPTDKSYKNMEAGERELKKDEVTGYFTHDVKIVRKKGKSKEWILKEVSDEKIARNEVASDEAFRLFCPDHPKARYISDEDQMNGVLVEKIQEATDLLAISQATNEEQMYRDLLKYFYDNQCQGLGRISLLGLWLDEDDMKLSNVMLSNGIFKKIDGGKSFSHYIFNDLPSGHRITWADITSLPDVKYFSAHNWLFSSVTHRDKAFLTPAEVQYEEYFYRTIQAEVKATLLEVLLLPDAIIKAFSEKYIAQNEVDDYINILTSRREQLKLAMLKDADFLTYLESPKAQIVTKEVQVKFANFIPAGKNVLIENVMDPSELGNAVEVQYERLKRDLHPSAVVGLCEGHMPYLENIKSILHNSHLLHKFDDILRYITEDSEQISDVSTLLAMLNEDELFKVDLKKLSSIADVNFVLSESADLGLDVIRELVLDGSLSPKECLSLKENSEALSHHRNMINLVVGALDDIGVVGPHLKLEMLLHPELAESLRKILRIIAKSNDEVNDATIREHIIGVINQNAPLKRDGQIILAHYDKYIQNNPLLEIAIEEAYSPKSSAVSVFDSISEYVEDSNSFSETEQEPESPAPKAISPAPDPFADFNDEIDFSQPPVAKALSTQGLFAKSPAEKTKQVAPPPPPPPPPVPGGSKR